MESIPYCDYALIVDIFVAVLRLSSNEVTHIFGHTVSKYKNIQMVPPHPCTVISNHF